METIVLQHGRRVTAGFRLLVPVVSFFSEARVLRIGTREQKWVKGLGLGT